jgi:tRNA-splicing ligase RtcB
VPLPQALVEARLSTSKLEHLRERQGPRQHGTLGGGNHFIELDRDSAGRLWAMVHSGSRGVGAAIFAHHLRVAELAEGAGLAGLDARRPEGGAYLGDLALAVELARANRRWMMDRVTEIIAETTGGQAEAEECIDVVHNFIRPELHEGRPLLVHRKGATTAGAGELAVIPGSMGTASYVVRGLGEPRSYASCSHGAGRVMSRTEAHRRVTIKDLERSMRGVVYDPRRAPGLIEEAPAAYRDIREVLEDQADLVEPLLRLVPILALKG